MQTGSEHARRRAARVNNGGPLILGWATNRTLYEWRLLVCSFTANSYNQDAAKLLNVLLIKYI